ncbi:MULTISPECIES: GUN4 domain-containing protein [Desertifilum]|nr:MULTISPECIES: GUN4 domain-containing protein [Desertifilum]
MFKRCHPRETGVAVQVVMSSQPQSESSELPLISANGVDYRYLQDLLKAGEWLEADMETARRMLEAARKEAEAWLEIADIDNFPGEDLHILDQLWLNYSKGRFGFSVQAQIYRSLGGTRNYDEKIWEAFGDRTGWCQHTAWLYYSDLTFNLSAPPGHLPALGWHPFMGYGGEIGWWAALFSRPELSAT